MARRGWLLALSLAAFVPTGCNKHAPKMPDPTKGAITGVVLCADTGKPARFSTVTFSAVPKADDKSDKGAPLPATETAITDLDGRFRLEAVEPGRYYAFATLEGYLDPMRGIDFARIDAIEGDREQQLEAIKEWKDHLVSVIVQVNRTADVTMNIERGAEINGTVAYDDGSPAIGMHFQILRKSEKGAWSAVGFSLFETWNIPTVSDGHGRFSLTGLPAGEYTVCALMPSDTQDAAARVCLGNTLRKKDAATVKLHAGEVLNGSDITIPLSGLSTVAGTVTALADGHGVPRGTLRLLYADDREKTRETTLAADGRFSFDYVPRGNFILQVAGGSEAEERAPGEGIQSYADKETPVTVLDDVDDINIALASLPKPASKP